MATVKEVKLMKGGAMVTPVTLIDSVKNLELLKKSFFLQKKRMNLSKNRKKVLTFLRYQ